MGAMAMAEMAPMAEPMVRVGTRGQAAADEGKARVIAEIARFSALLDRAALGPGADTALATGRRDTWVAA